MPIQMAFEGCARISGGHIEVHGLVLRAVWIFIPATENQMGVIAVGSRN